MLQAHFDKVANPATVEQPSNPSSIPTFIPSIINSALSVEMYFKCLLQFDNGAFLISHDLLNLFNALSMRRQQRLTELHDEVVKNNLKLKLARATFGEASVKTPTLIELLTKGRHAFVDWRYFFELAEVDRPVVEFEPLRVAARVTVMEIKPEWAKLLDDFGPLPEVTFNKPNTQPLGQPNLLIMDGPPYHIIERRMPPQADK